MYTIHVFCFLWYIVLYISLKHAGCLAAAVCALPGGGGGEFPQSWGVCAVLPAAVLHCLPCDLRPAQRAVH